MSFSVKVDELCQSVSRWRVRVTQCQGGGAVSLSVKVEEQCQSVSRWRSSATQCQGGASESLSVKVEELWHSVLMADDNVTTCQYRWSVSMLEDPCQCTRQHDGRASVFKVEFRCQDSALSISRSCGINVRFMQDQYRSPSRLND